MQNSNHIHNNRLINVPLSSHPQGVGADPHTAFALSPDSKLHKEKAEDPPFQLLDPDNMTISIGRAGHLSGKPPFIYPHRLLFCWIPAALSAALFRAAALF